MRRALWVVALAGLGAGLLARLVLAAGTPHGVPQTDVPTGASAPPVTRNRGDPSGGSPLLRALRREEARLVQAYGVPPMPPADLPEGSTDPEVIDQRLADALRARPEVDVIAVDCEPWPCVITLHHPKDVPAQQVAETVQAALGLSIRRLGGGESLDPAGTRWWSLAVLPDIPLSPAEERYLHLRGSRQQDRIPTGR